jgi:hypothetical protein
MYAIETTTAGPAKARYALGLRRCPLNIPRAAPTLRSVSDPRRTFKSVIRDLVSSIDIKR